LNKLENILKHKNKYKNLKQNKYIIQKGGGTTVGSEIFEAGKPVDPKQYGTAPFVSVSPQGFILDLFYKMFPGILNWDYNKTHCPHPSAPESIDFEAIKNIHFRVYHMLDMLKKEEEKRKKV